ncbi:MAG TPA: zf-HC2 domain-containing protein, partial [Pyrinomonadaceae bacterium]|nr:zf-HC2 domain-containing protein [Pyrinomonadaceae bacterium]
MSCQQTHELIHGYIDGELELLKSIEIEKHLQQCENCSQAYKATRSLQSTLASSALRFEPPSNLERRLRSALRRESRSETKSFIFGWR